MELIAQLTTHSAKPTQEMNDTYLWIVIKPNNFGLKLACELALVARFI